MTRMLSVAALHALVVLVALAIAAVPTQAGTAAAPEITDKRLDEATVPGGVPLCQAGTCPPAFTAYPGDIEQAWLGPEDATSLHLNIQINGTGASSTTQWTWIIHWTREGTDEQAGVTMQLTGGQLVCNGLAETCTLNATGPASSTVLDLAVPLAALGNPAAKATLTGIWAESQGQPEAAAPSQVGMADRAPDSGTGSDYMFLGPRVAPAANGTLTSSSSSSSSQDAGTSSNSSAGPAPALVLAALVGLAVLLRRR